VNLLITQLLLAVSKVRERHTRLNSFKHLRRNHKIKHISKIEQAKNVLFLAVGSVGCDDFLDSIARGQFEPLADEPLENVPSVRTVPFYPIGFKKKNSVIIKIRCK
jgi:hypothetical protein